MTTPSIPNSSKAPRPLPTQAFLQDRFTYDPETGFVCYREELHGRGYSRRAKPGIPIGSRTCYGYLEVGIDKKSHKLHRLIYKWMTGEDPDQIDHENGVRDDNRWVNIRSCTPSQNSMHRANRKTGESGIRNVYYRHTHPKPWVARVTKEGKRISKSFYDIADAEVWAIQKRNELHGEFAVQEVSA